LLTNYRCENDKKILACVVLLVLLFHLFVPVGLCHLLEWCTCGVTECKFLTKAQDITVLLKLEDKKEFASQLLFHKYWLSRGRHCLRNKKV
jgi:hypothetical protein